MPDQQQTNDRDAKPADASGREKANGPRISATDKQLVIMLICGALGYWFVTSASNSLDGAVAAERAAKAEEVRKNNPWAKD